MEHQHEDMAELVYRGEDETRYTDRWVRFLAREEVAEGGQFAAAPHAHELSPESWEAAVAFSRELFGALYDQADYKVEVPGKNADVIQTWWEKVEDVDTWKEQREQCEGDSFRSGMLAGAVVEYVCRVISEQEQELDDKGEPTADENGMSQALVDAVSQALAGEEEDEEKGSAIAEAMEKAGDEADEFEEELKANIHGDKPGTPITKEPARAVVERMRANPSFKSVMQLVGQMRPIVRKMRSKKKVDWMRDEVIGIETGGEIDRILSSEAMALMDPDLELDFMRRLTEAQVTQRRMHGIDDAGRGPVVFCLDESGSMNGHPDDWAKAVAISMAEVAMKERRPFSLVHFDYHVSRVDDVNKPIDVDQLVEMVSYFSGGGTAFDPPIHEALRKIKSERVLRSADIVLLTDGWGSISEGLVEEMKRSETRLHVVAIGVDEINEDVAKIADSVAFIPSLNPDDIEAMQVAFQAV